MIRWRYFLPLLVLMLPLVLLVAAACGGEEATPAPAAAGGITAQELQEALAAIPATEPVDVAAIARQVAAGIDVPEGLSQEDLNTAIDAAVATIPEGLSQTDMSAAITRAIDQIPEGLTAAQMQAAIATAVEGAVSEAVSEAVAAAIPEEKPFYEGRTIRVLVGFSAGGGYDTYARAIARHFGKHVPGNPDMVVENMTGAGSMISANYLFNEAKPDGLTLGEWNSNHLLIQALNGNPGILWAGEKFAWISAPSDGNPVCAAMGFTGIDSMEEMIATPGLKFGATSEFGGSLSDIPRFFNKYAGADWQVISGYRGTARVRLGLQEKETDAACWSWESVGVTARSMLDAEGDDKFIVNSILYEVDDSAPIVVAAGPEAAGLPSMRNFITDPDGQRLWDLWAVGYNFQRPWTAPPGTPEDRIQILRQAYADTMVDPEFLADAAQAGLYISPVTGQEIEGIVAQVLRLTKDDCEALQFLVLDRGSC